MTVVVLTLSSAPSSSDGDGCGADNARLPATGVGSDVVWLEGLACPADGVGGAAFGGSDTPGSDNDGVADVLVSVADARCALNCGEGCDFASEAAPLVAARNPGGAVSVVSRRDEDTLALNSVPAGVAGRGGRSDAAFSFFVADFSADDGAAVTALTVGSGGAGG